MRQYGTGIGPWVRRSGRRWAWGIKEFGTVKPLGTATKESDARQFSRDAVTAYRASVAVAERELHR